MKDDLLSAIDISKRFEGVHVLDSLTFRVAQGEIKTLIGPNGAGKTTLFNIISGLERPDSGHVYFDGKEITGMDAQRIAEMGLSRTFQTNQVFEYLNVVENVMVGRYLKTHVSFLMAGFWPPSVYREEHRNLVKTYEILEFMDLYDKANRKVSQVSYLERKLVELGRAIAMEPKLIMLDEPFGGLNLAEIKRVSDRIIKLREQGLSVVMIDHHFGMVSKISDEISVLYQGKIIAEGDPEAVKKNKAVRAAYFIDEGE